LAKAWLVCHRRRTERLKFHRNRFFETAVLITDMVGQDETISSAYLDRLRILVSEMDAPSNLKRIMSAAMQVDKEIQEGTFKPIATGILPQGWGGLLWDYFLAASYTSPIRGFVFRNMLANLIDPRTDDRNTDAVDRRGSFLPTAAGITMPARKPPPPNEKPQYERFLEAAREHGTSEDPEVFERIFRQVVNPPAVKPSASPVHRTGKQRAS
jgi:hypothetical protein